MQMCKDNRPPSCGGTCGPTDMALNAQQLMRLIRGLLPDASEAHMRYLQLLLDADGNNLITYKELATAFKAAARGSLQVGGWGQKGGRQISFRVQNFEGLGAGLGVCTYSLGGGR